MDIRIKKIRPVMSNTFEVVERKGLGHPDTIADGLAEITSIEYAKYCLKKFGAILHHNTDKTIVFGGQCRLKYGSGSLLKPYTILFGGRMSRSFNGIKIPIVKIQKKAGLDKLDAF